MTTDARSSLLSSSILASGSWLVRAVYLLVSESNAGVRVSELSISWIDTWTSRPTSVASDDASTGASSSTMVPVAVFAVPSTAFADELASVTVNVSSFSSSVSSVVAIVSVARVAPAAIVSVRALAAV